MAGRLYICATPIGNLGDMTPRAVEVLNAVDTVLAEDTRVTRKLLTHFGIATPLERFDEPTSAKRVPEVVHRLVEGECFALVSDAGTPLVSDPGYRLVAAAQDAGVAVECVPGPSAVTAALSVSGLPTASFYFGGFLPRKRGEIATTIAQLGKLQATLVFFESPHRLVGSLEVLAEMYPDRQGAVVREISKLHEEIVRLDLPELAAEFAGRESVRGEIVLLIGPPSPSETVQVTQDHIAQELGRAMASGQSASRAARDVAARLGVSRGEVYDLAVQLYGRAKGPQA